MKWSLTIGGITKDKNDNLYLGKVQDKAITVIKQGKIVGNLIQDDRLLWLDAMDIHENFLYIPCPQLKLLAKMNKGISKTRGKFSLYRYPLKTKNLTLLSSLDRMFSLLHSLQKYTF